MRLMAKFGERFSFAHSLMWRCLPSSNLCLKLKLTRLSLSAKLRRSGINRIIGVTPASLLSDILPFTTPKIDSTGSELALCDSPSLTNASSRSIYSNMNEPTLHCRSFPDIRLVATIRLHRQIVSRDQPLFFTFFSIFVIQSIVSASSSTREALCGTKA